MHALLGTPQRQIVCHDLIKAFEECHRTASFAKFGACNEQKEALALCLRQERIERTTRNREESKERNAKKKAVWEALEREQAQEGVRTEVLE
ncbi:hypothetical protein IAT38_003982 [Cryptococcus sp. DSM 104549]